MARILIWIIPAILLILGCGGARSRTAATVLTGAQTPGETEPTPAGGSDSSAANSGKALSPGESDISGEEAARESDLSAGATDLSRFTFSEFDPGMGLPPLFRELPADFPSPWDEIKLTNPYSVEIDPTLGDRIRADLQNARFEIPVVVNKEVLYYLDFYQTRARRSMELGLRRAARYLPLFERIFQEEGVPRDLIFMAHVESLFHPLAISRARARGIWQFMQGTGRLYDLDVNWWVDERSDLEKSTRAAARHLRDLHEQFGDWHLVLAAYNCGPARVARALERHGPMDYWTMVERRHLPRETRLFVPAILAAVMIHRLPERFGFEPPLELPFEYDTIEIPFQIDLRTIAEESSIDAEELLGLNPQLLRGVTPPEALPYRVHLPSGSREAVATALERIPPERRLRFAHHRVRKGETLSAISARYGASIRALAETNRIRNVHRLRIGQELLIPLSLSDAPPSRAYSAPQVYTVRRGDSLYRIARRFGLNVRKLMELNRLESQSILQPGQRLRLQEATSTDGGS
ncbi:MAG TPA: LysM peptidoglycan-binding domain-containing protein [Acidobacteriota bacterium]|nr:LysM peptidoglycan-binding domain-containing protein [Acidobacteriota bacterium]